MNKKNILRILLATVLILMILAIAMQFNAGFDWGLADFIIAGVLLMGAGLVYEWIASTTGNTRRRRILTVTLVIVFIYIWAELGVGIFNIPGISGD